MNRYFAMLDTGNVVLIPGATTWHEASDIADEMPGCTHWIFHEDSLREFVAEATAALEG